MAIDKAGSLEGASQQHHQAACRLDAIITERVRPELVQLSWRAQDEFPVCEARQGAELAQLIWPSVGPDRFVCSER